MPDPTGRTGASGNAGSDENRDDERGRSPVEVTRRGLLRATGVAAAVGVLGAPSAAERVEVPGVAAVGADGRPLLGGRRRSIRVGDDEAGSAARLETGRRRLSEFGAGPDWYAVDAGAGESLTVAFERAARRGPAAVALYGPDGALLDMAYAATGATATLPVTTAVAGTHLVEVTDASGAGGAYALDVGRGDAAPASAPVRAQVDSASVARYLEAESAAGGSSFAPFEVREDDDASGGEYVVSEAPPRYDEPLPGEAVARYEFSVPTDGEYALWGRTRAQSNGNSVYVDVDGGSSIYWAMEITDDWTWAELGRFYEGETETLSLSAGEHVLEVRHREPGTRVDRLLVTDDLEFVPSGTGGESTEPSDDGDEGGDDDGSGGEDQSPYGDGPVDATGRVEAERFDEGGPGVAYADDDAENRGGAFRDAGVDVQETSDDDGYNVGWMKDGEWLEYTVVVPESGSYAATARLASPSGDGALLVAVDGERVARIDVPETGAWQSWSTETDPAGTLSAGEHTLRLEVEGGEFNLNWVAFDPSGDAEPDDPGDGDESEDAGDGDDGDARVRGERRAWHKVTVAFDGPETDEDDDPNPFLDRRLDVTFEGPSGQTYEVPGYYAADGDAADTGATGGSTWHAHLAPDEAGEWSYEASFVEGDDVAVDGGGEPTSFDGASGTFTVDETDKSGRDFRAHGALEAVGEHYLRFAGSGDHFLKIGADSPENFLAYDGFDDTYSTGGSGPGGPNSFVHDYGPHVDDWSPGDPTWGDGRGKGIVGVVNYLAGKGINAQYFLTYNVDGGDGSDVWPWTSPDERLRYDVSKLAQWERLFEHMTREGVMLHVVTQEEENDQGLDGGALGVERRLYYRELVARFGHHPAVTWNLGEENTNTDGQREAFLEFFEEIDPYDGVRCVHTFPNEKEEVYADLLGRDDVAGPSLQTSYDPRGDVLEWRRRSAAAGRPWVVMADEIGDWKCGIPADGESCMVTQAEARRDSLWGSLMAGAGGVEWYFGYETVGGDLRLEDYRTRDDWWDYNRYAHEFLVDLPLPEMAPDDGRLSNVDGEAHCLAHPDGDVAVVYLHEATDFDVALDDADYALRWLDPETGAESDAGTVQGSAYTDVDAPPFGGDAVALFERE
jgi:hypothetical protein